MTQNDTTSARLTQIAEHAVAQWQERASADWDRQLAAFLADWKGDADRRVDQEIGRLTTEIARELVRMAGGDDRMAATGGADIGRLLGRLITSGITEALGGGSRRRTREYETDRSRQEEERFRESRSQQQAQSLRDQARGERNL